MKMEVRFVKDSNIRTPVERTRELLKHASREVKSPIDVGKLAVWRSLELTAQNDNMFGYVSIDGLYDRTIRLFIQVSLI